MGEVWRASHRLLARPAAVKLVKTDSLGWDQDTALAALLVAHASKEPVPPSERSGAKIPVSLDALVLDCLKKDPADRVQSADEIVGRLRTGESGDPWTQERAENWWAEVF